MRASEIKLDAMSNLSAKGSMNEPKNFASENVWPTNHQCRRLDRLAEMRKKHLHIPVGKETSKMALLIPSEIR